MLGGLKSASGRPKLPHFRLRTSRLRQLPIFRSSRASRCRTAFAQRRPALRPPGSAARTPSPTRQIAHAVLVVNRQRLGRFAHDRRRDSRASPASSRQHAAASSCRRARRHASASARSAVDPDRIVGAARRPAALDRAPEARARALLEPGRARRRGRARAPRARRAIASGPLRARSQQPRGQRRQRQQIEPVVLEHRLERPRVAAAHELEVARRESRSRARRRAAARRRAGARAPAASNLDSGRRERLRDHRA